MGWQLFPTGIGWRSFDRTVEEGTFACPNSRCVNGPDGAQRYRVRTGRNWFTILFIPLIPLNQTGSYLQCRKCKSAMPISVLDGARDGPANAITETEVVFELEEWSDHHLEHLLDQLSERSVSFEMDGRDLVVDKRHEALVDHLVDEITGSPARNALTQDGT